MTSQELIARARSMIGRGIRYRLGSGGIDPNASMPASVDAACDCSGFVCWCLGVSRKTDHPLYLHFNGGWINTDAIVFDAGHSTGFFTCLSQPTIGCLVVYPKHATRKVGHVGIVTGTDNSGMVTQVLHCSASNYRRSGDAIQITVPNVFFTTHTIYVWYSGVI